jgi:hypothetical protein
MIRRRTVTVLTVTAAVALAVTAVGATPAQARTRPYVIGNTADEPTPEVTASRLGVSDADGNHLTWLAPTSPTSHHADASRDARTLAYLTGTNSASSGDRLPARLVIKHDGGTYLLRNGRISPPDVTPDGRFVVWGQDRDVYRFDVRTRAVARLWRAPVGQQIETVGYSPDRTRLLVTSLDFPAVGAWHLRLVRTSDGVTLLHRTGLFSDIYERPEWSPGSTSVLVFWHTAATSPRPVRVTRSGGVYATAIRYPLRCLNWRTDGIFALDPVHNRVMRTAVSTVAPVVSWRRTGPGRTLDSIVLVDARPA